MIEIELAAPVLFTIAGLPVTNSMLTSWLVVAIIVIFFRIAVRRAALVPTGIYNVAEAVFEGFLNFMDVFSGARERTVRFLPFIGTAFFYILVSNFIGLFPPIGQLTFTTTAGDTHALFKTPTSDYNLPLALGIIGFVMAWAMSIREYGVIGHLRKYIHLNPMDTFLGLMDIVSDFARIISLSFRLFGNILSGEVLILVMTSLFNGSVAYGIPLVFMALGLISGVVQAIVLPAITLMAFRASLNLME